jgi:hypothetical protein
VNCNVIDPIVDDAIRGIKDQAVDSKVLLAAMAKGVKGFTGTLPSLCKRGLNKKAKTD